MLEYLKLCLFIVAITMAYAFVQHDYYHKKFDKPIAIEYNCSMLNYETPKDVVDLCNDTKRRFVIVKTY